MTDRARVVVTGAGGFIGRAVLAAAPSSWDVTAVSRQAPPSRPGVDLVTLEDPTGPLPEKLTGTEFDAIIHLAGSADHGLAVRAPWEDLRATGVVAGALLARIRARRIVLLSSAAVYAGHEGEVGPDRCLDPSMAYALSKRYVEGLVAALVQSGHAGSATVVRLYNAFGPGERPTRLIPRIFDAIRSGSPFILTGDPRSLSDPVPVDHVAACLIAAIELGPDGLFDLCGGDPRPLDEQVRRIAGILGDSRLEVEIRPDPTQTPIRFWSDPSALLNALARARPDPLEMSVARYAAVQGWLPPSA